MKYLHYVTITHVAALLFCAYWFLATNELLLSWDQLGTLFVLTIFSFVCLTPKLIEHT